MNNVTPENLVTITQGATPLQIAILVILGIIALGVVIGIVKWVIDIKLGTLPADISAIRKELKELGLQIAKLQGDLWSKDEVDNRVNAAIKEHIEQCPYHHNNK